MADFRANFCLRSIPAAIQSSFVRNTATATDVGLTGTYTVKGNNIAAYKGSDGLYLERLVANTWQNPSFTGAVSGTPGTIATAWTSVSAGGTITVSSAPSTLGSQIRFQTTSAQHVWHQGITLVANGIYVHSVEILATNGIAVEQIINMSGLPSGASIGYRMNGASVAGSSASDVGVLCMVLTVGGTGGNFNSYLGVGAVSSVTADVTLAHPMREHINSIAGTLHLRSSYIHGTTAANVTRGMSYVSATSMSAMGLASTNNNYTAHVVIKVPAASSDMGGDGKIFQFGNGGNSDILTLEFSSTQGDIILRKTVSSTSTSLTISTGGWSAGDVLNIRFSMSSTGGVIFKCNSSTQTNSGLTANLASNITRIYLGTDALEASSASPNVIMKGFRAWDTALDATALDALSADDFSLANVIMSSAFTGTDGVELTAYVPEINTTGNSWVGEAMLTSDGAPGVDDQELTNNKLEIAISGSGASFNTGVTDYRIKFRWEIGGTGGNRIGIYFRWADLNNHYYFNCREAEDDWTLYKRSAGTQTVVATGSTTFATSTNYDIEVDVQGTVAHLYKNGASVSGNQTLDSHLTATKIGIGTRTVSAVQVFDDFLVTGYSSISLDASEYEPGETISITKSSNWVGTPTATLNGVTIALTDISGAVASAVVPAKTLFAASQSHVNTPWNSNITLVVTDSAGPLNATLQIVPVDIGTGLASYPGSGNHSGIRAGTQQNAVVTGAVDGDYQHAYWEVGNGIANAESSYGRAVVVPSTLRVMAYRAGAWLAHRVVSFANDTDNWPFRDEFTDTNGVALSAHTPNANSFPAGWSSIERDASYNPTASTLVSIQGNALQISGATRGVSVNTQRVTKTVELLWPCGAANEYFVWHVARTDDNTWLSLVVDASLDRITMYQFLDGAAVGVGIQNSVPVTFAAGSTYTLRAQLVEPVSPSLLHTVVVDVNGVEVLNAPVNEALPSTATRMGIYSGDVLPININAAYIDAQALGSFSISLSAEEAVPGAVIVVTKTGGNYNGAVTATYRGISATIGGVVTNTANLTVPALSTFLQGGTHVLTDWFTNYIVAVTDTDGTFTASLRIIVNSGYANSQGPFDNTLAGLQSPDPVYGRIISGTPALYPEKVRALGVGSVGWRYFAARSGGWSAESTFGATMEYPAYFKKRLLPLELVPYYLRASDAANIAADQTIATVTSNVAAFDGTNGLILEGARTNALLRSHDLATGSTARGTGTRTFNASGGPRAGQGYTAFTGINAVTVDDVFLSITAGTSTNPIAVSFYIRKVSNTGTVQLDHPAGSSFGRWQINLASVGSGWQAIYPGHSAVTITTAFTVNPTPSHGWHFSASAGGPLSFDIAEFQQELNQNYPSTPILTAGSTVTRATAGLAVTSLTAVGIASQTQNYSFHAVLKMPASHTQMGTDVGTVCMFAQGTSDTVNLFWVEISAVVAGRIYLNHRANSVTRNVFISTTWAKGDTLNIRASWSSTNGGVLRVNSSVVTDTGMTAVMSSAADRVLVNRVPSGGVYDSHYTLVGMRLYDTALDSTTLDGLSSTAFDSSPAIIRSESTAGGLAATTTPAIPLPATVVAGDKLLVVASASVDQVTIPTATWPAGWTEVFDTYVDENNGIWMSVAERTSDGTEGGGTVTPTLTVSERVAHKAWSIANAGTIYAATASDGTASSSSVNPPNLTPAGGPANYLWIALAAIDSGDISRVYGTFPGGYIGTGQIQSGANFNNDNTLGWARKTELLTSENPGTFESGGADQWVAATLAIGPAPTSTPQVGDAVVRSVIKNVIRSIIRTVVN